MASATNNVLCTKMVYKSSSTNFCWKELINQAIFERIYVVEEGEVDRADLAAPFSDLLDESFQEELKQATAEALAPETANRRGLSSADGWNDSTKGPERPARPNMSIDRNKGNWRPRLDSNQRP